MPCTEESLLSCHRCHLWLLPASAPFKTKQHRSRRSGPGLAARPQPAARSLDGGRRLRRKMALRASAAISGTKPPAARAASPPAPRPLRSVGLTAALFSSPSPALHPRPVKEERPPASLSLTGSGSSRRRRQGGLPRCLPVRLGRRGGGRGACAGGASVGGSGSEGWAGGVRAVQPPGWHAGRRAPRHWGGLRIFEPRAAHYQGIGQAAAVRGGGQSRAEEGFRKSPFTLGHRCFVRLG